MQSSFLASSPNDWEIRRFGEVAKITCGVAATPEYVDESVGVPFLSARNVQREKLDLSKYMHIPVELHKKLTKNTKPEKGDILMTRVGAGIGEAAVVDVDFEFSVYVSLTLIKPGKNIDSEYVKSLLNTDYYRYLAIREQFAGGGVQNLNVKMVKEYQLAVPPIAEQKKIAKILSTWDKAIATVEKLIANSQQQKKALMQQLLTGKKRLPGFEGEFSEYRLDEVCAFKKGKGLSKGAVAENGVNRCILYGELYTRYGEVVTEVISRTDSGDGAVSVAGDVLIPSSTTTSGIDLANATAILEDGVLLGGDINILRPKIKKINPEYLAYLLTHVKKHEIASRAQGITIIHLYGSDLKPIKVNLPPVAEQEAVVTVMTAADKLIDSLRSQHGAYIQEKKSLMQQLLTGKRRVTVN